MLPTLLLLPLLHGVALAQELPEATTHGKSSTLAVPPPPPKSPTAAAPFTISMIDSEKEIELALAEHLEQALSLKLSRILVDTDPNDVYLHLGFDMEGEADLDMYVDTLPSGRSDMDNSLTERVVLVTATPEALRVRRNRVDKALRVINSHQLGNWSPPHIAIRDDRQLVLSYPINIPGPEVQITTDLEVDALSRVISGWEELAPKLQSAGVWE